MLSRSVRSCVRTARIASSVGRRAVSGAPDEARQRVLKEFEARSADLEKSFGSPESGTPAEHLWMTSFVEHQSVEYLSTAFGRWFQEGGVGQDPGYRPSVAGFLSGVIPTLSDDELEDFVLRATAVAPDASGLLATVLRMSAHDAADAQADRLRAVLSRLLRDGEGGERSGDMRVLEVAFDAPRIPLLDWPLLHRTGRGKLLGPADKSRAPEVAVQDALPHTATARSVLERLWQARAEAEQGKTPEGTTAEQIAVQTAGMELMYLMEASRSQVGLSWGRFFATGNTAYLTRVLDMASDYADVLLPGDNGGHGESDVAVDSATAWDAILDGSKPIAKLPNALRDRLLPLAVDSDVDSVRAAATELSLAASDPSSSPTSSAIMRQDRARRLQISRMALGSLLLGAQEHEAVTTTLADAIRRDAAHYRVITGKGTIRKAPRGEPIIPQDAHHRMVVLPGLFQLISQSALRNLGLPSPNS